MRYLLTLLLFSLAHLLQAQPDMRIYSVAGFSNPETYYYGAGTGSDIIITMINDDDDDEASEDISILYLTDKMILEGALPATMIPEQQVIIAPSSTVDLPANDFQINPDQFRVGGNIVVIWPSFVDPLTDTLEVVVTVNDTLGVGFDGFLENPEIRKGIVQRLHGVTTDLPPEIVSVEVYTLSGACVRTYSSDEAASLGDLPKGLLLVHVKTTSNTYFNFIHKSIP